MPPERRGLKRGQAKPAGGGKKVEKKNSGAEETGGKNRPASRKEERGWGTRGGKIETEGVEGSGKAARKEQRREVR